jgi:DNA/RNA-binding domain of Phe-tRNA-synthetase-like protein
MKNFKFRADGEPKGKLCGLALSHILFSGAKNSPKNPCVNEEFEKARAATLEAFSDASKINENENVAAMRRLFSRIGIDPTKERPSAEALIRRAVSSKGLYRINAIVDINNIVSLRSACPCGVYDLSKIEGDEISVLVGGPNDSYEGISGRPIKGENHILTADSKSVFGGPSADSKRTCVTPGSSEILMLIYHPSTDTRIGEWINYASSLMEKCTGAKKENEGRFCI